jgi:beta-N-acetylhexosaminidase
MPTVDESAAELERDLAPFRALATTATIGMTGHLLFPIWDEEHPATLSPTIIRDVIRGTIGFDGLLLTDDIDMEALTDTVPERSARAIAAGCDIVLNCWAKMDDMIGTCAALPAMDEAAAARLDRALQGTRIRGEPGDEHADLIAERDALLALAEEAA